MRFVPIDAKFVWPKEALPDMLERVAREMKATRRPTLHLDHAPAVNDPTDWMSWGARHYGLDMCVYYSPLFEFGKAITQDAPVIVSVSNENDETEGYLFILSSSEEHCRLLAHDRAIRTFSKREVLTRHWSGYAELEDDIRERIDAYTDLIEEKAAYRLVLESHPRNISRPIWTFRNQLSNPLLALAKETRIARLFARLTLLQILSTGIGLFVWLALGLIVTSPKNEVHWLGGWALLVLGRALLGVLLGYTAQRLSLEVVTLMKRLMMVGAVSIDGDLVKGEGSGKSLSRAFEADSISTTITGLGTETVSVIVSVLYVFISFTLTPLPIILSLVFLATLIVGGYFATSFLRSTYQRVAMRMDQTHDLIELMVGFRTLVSQGAPWRHSEKDQKLSRYVSQSERADKANVFLLNLAAYGWLVAGLILSAIVALVFENTILGLGATVGSVLFGFNSLQRLTALLAGLVPAYASWRCIDDIFSAARTTPSPSALYPEVPEFVEPGTALVSMREVSFRYPRSSGDVLKGVNWTIRAGQRFLLLGRSGGGKSTLVSLLSGLREPNHGILFVGGHDSRSLGLEGLRPNVALAPQFHENVLLPGSLIFNLCLGRRWPASVEDRTLAREICVELGLGPLLQRMPAGLDQLVGEAGWTLSHGESSRVFLARTLLQNAKVIILDESFAALDPETLIQCMDCVRKRASALIVIAHP